VFLMIFINPLGVGLMKPRLVVAVVLAIMGGRVSADQLMTFDNGMTCMVNPSGHAYGCSGGAPSNGIAYGVQTPRNQRGNQGYRESYIGGDGYRYTDPSLATGDCDLVDTANGWQCRSGR
jgi:hypothetical protein